MRSWFLLFQFFIVSTGFATSAISEKLFVIKKSELSYLINKGYFNTALLKCEKLLGSNLSKNQRYEILTTQSKLYFWEENMYAYKMSAQKAVQLKNEPIYKAYYHAQIAFYYHYSFVGDSTVIHADKALELLRNNYSQRHKIAAHYIYQMYATSFLYRNNYYKISGDFVTDQKARIVPVVKYLDSAIRIVDEIPHFPQEKAILFRSLGNRLFDLVGYDVRASQSDFKHPIFEKEVFRKVINAQSRAISCLPKSEKRLRKNLDASLAMVYYTCLMEDKADSITQPYIKRFYRNPIGEMGPSILNSLSLLSYYIKNAIAKDYPPERLLKVKAILERILPFWRMYLSQENKNFFDAYNISPNYQLLQIQEYFLRKKASLANKNDMLNLTLDRFSYYSKNSYQKQNSPANRKKFNELVVKMELNSTNKLALQELKILAKPWENIDLGKKIQKRLKKEEAVIVNISNADSYPFFILVRKDFIDVVKLNSFWVGMTNEEINQFSAFKKKGFEIFKHSKILPEIIKSKINKLYVTSDFNLPFDWVVTDLKGKQFDELSYFKRQVNVVKMYNPIDFFISNNGENFAKKHTKYVWLNSASVGRVPFSGEFIKKKKGLPTILRTSDFTQKGILQIIGHGGLEYYTNVNYKNSTLESEELDDLRNIEFKVNKDLIIFNVCHAGSKRAMNIFDLGINNLLLSRGTKAVIASPYQTIDQSSAYIFKKFYHYLFKGETVEDALQLAKLDYLKTHTGMEAHPQYWSTYELTSNVKDLRLALDPIPDKSWQAYLVLLVLIAIVLWFYLYWED
jgi:hypothetical protein